MTDNDMTDAFLKKHAPNLDTHQLALELGSLGVQTSQALTQDVHVHPFDLSHGMQQGVEDAIYNAILRNHPKDFVAGKDSWPTLRTTKDKHAMAPCAQSTQRKRNDTLKAIYRRYCEISGCVRPIYDEGGYHWLQDTERVLTAATFNTDQTYKSAAGIQLCAQALKMLCMALQQGDLLRSYTYHLSGLAYAKEMHEKETSEASDLEGFSLSEEQLAALYAQIKTMGEEALQILEANRSRHGMKPHDLQVIIDYLCLALIWGDAPGLLQPQRNDMKSFIYKTPYPDVNAKANYIDIVKVVDNVPTVTLTINKRNKVDSDKYERVMDLTPNRLLCRVLHCFQLQAKDLQEPRFGNVDCPTKRNVYVLFNKAGEPYDTGNLSSRVDYMWKSRLEAKLGFRASGCNIARRCAVEEARRKHGKRRMTNAEKEEERKQARQRGHSVSTADAHY
jgi:hypothetical protein